MQFSISRMARMASMRAGMLMLACMQFATAANVAIAADVETIILVRHGEKPDAGLGQLTCQGLNRALALPAVIAAKYGKPDFILAPNPSQQKDDRGTRYDYVRPLATVEPSAVYFAMPVNTAIGFADMEQLHDTLLAPQYHRSVVLVGWEHRIIEDLVRKIVVEHGGDGATVPRWDGADFDSIYLLRITRADGATRIHFSIDKEGLNQRPLTCPGS